MRGLWLGVLVVVAACSGNPPPPPDGGTDGGVTTSNTYALTVSPSGTFKLAVGGEIDLVARVFDASGALVSSTAEQPVYVGWTSSNPSAVTVDVDGAVKGIGPGTATVTAMVQGTGETISVEIEVLNADMAAIFLSPSRMVLDVGAQRELVVTAVDSAGAPTTLDCGSNGVVLGSDASVLTATYDGTLGTEKIVVTGVKKGLTVLTLDCNGFQATPVIIEVKPPVTIPPPQGISGADFGHFASLYVSKDRLHVASHDLANGKLIYTHFQGVWSSEVLDGEGTYGRHTQVLVDPLSQRPVVCARENVGITCWLLQSSGFWTKRPVVAAAEDAPMRLLANAAGELFLAFTRGKQLLLARSTAATRDDWTETLVIFGDVPYFDVVLGPDGKPRFAAQLGDKLHFGQLNADGSTTFEVVDATTGTPPAGTGVRLAIGADNRPQVAYLKNGNLVHALRSGGQWGIAVLGTYPVGAPYSLGWAVTSRSQPRVSFVASGLRHGVRFKTARLNATNHWLIDVPSVKPLIGPRTTLVIDALDRSQIVFYDQVAQRPGHAIDPLPLDYSVPNASDVEPASNSTVAAGLDLRACYFLESGRSISRAYGNGESVLLVDFSAGSPPNRRSMEVSQDGRFVAFYGLVGSLVHAYLMPSSGEPPVKLADGASSLPWAQAWSPTTNDLVYGQAGGNGTLYRSSAETGLRQTIAINVTINAFDPNAALRWSSDGLRFNADPARKVSNKYLFQATCSTTCSWERRLWADTAFTSIPIGDVAGSSVTPSPEGDRLVVFRRTGEVVIAPSDYSTPQVVATAASGTWSVAFSQDGQYVAITGPGGTTLYNSDAPATTAPLGAGKTFRGWVAPGDALLYSDTAGYWLASPLGANPVKLFDGLASAHRPSPDGTKVLFVAGSTATIVTRTGAKVRDIQAGAAIFNLQISPQCGW